MYGTWVYFMASHDLSRETAKIRIKRNYNLKKKVLDIQNINLKYNISLMYNV